MGTASCLFTYVAPNLDSATEPTTKPNILLRLCTGFLSGGSFVGGLVGSIGYMLKKKGIPARLCACVSDKYDASLCIISNNR